MNEEIVISQFYGDQVNELKSLIHSTVKQCYPICYAPEVVSFFLDYHSTDELLRKAKEGTILVAFKNSLLVATGYLVNKELGGVYIHSEYQKQGIGRKMVKKLLQVAKERKLDSIWLDSTPFAVELYKQFGFHVAEEKVMYVEGNVPLAYYYMEKEIV